MVYGTYGLVSVSKRKPRWLVKLVGAVIIAVLVGLFVYRFF